MLNSVHSECCRRGTPPSVYRLVMKRSWVFNAVEPFGKSAKTLCAVSTEIIGHVLHGACRGRNEFEREASMSAWRVFIENV